ncbi:uncharacterized protein LOC119987207 [Tripterygium wilfordii]|uniref:uncharacterized protein LOC119987207 n=1 Tax=Tripterygium wilfordii TaxID=458696 RepID=UPI0018F84F8E|nr:uncharacterized protein LOC119987207 [Tripterygium wilfordii]
MEETAPMKSQPLHNFSLSLLKWSTNNTTNHRRSHPEPGQQNREKSDSIRPLRVGSRSARPHHRFASCSSSIGPKTKPARHASSPESGTAQKEVGLPHNNNNDTEAEEEEREEQEGKDEQVEDGGETAQRPWNLRPRKVISTRVFMNENERTYNGNGNSKEFPAQGNQQPKSMRLRGMAASATETAAQEVFGGGNGGEKRRFWIALSKDEIEEDIFVMTGNRPSRRPKKRPKNVQKQLDVVFPGMWLVGASADAYRVAEAPVKR